MLQQRLTATAVARRSYSLIPDVATVYRTAHDYVGQGEQGIGRGVPGSTKLELQATVGASAVVLVLAQAGQHGEHALCTGRQRTSTGSEQELLLFCLDRRSSFVVFFISLGR